MDELEKIVHRQSWQAALRKQTKPSRNRRIQLQRDVGLRNLHAMMPREEEDLPKNLNLR